MISTFKVLPVRLQGAGEGEGGGHVHFFRHSLILASWSPMEPGGAYLKSPLSFLLFLEGRKQ